jgi:neutral trehalase
MMFIIELETRNEGYKHWNRKLFTVEKAAKLFIHLQTAKSFNGEKDFNETIRQANSVWELIKENGKEEETKFKCRNIIAEVCTKPEDWKMYPSLQQKTLNII